MTSIQTTRYEHSSAQGIALVEGLAALLVAVMVTAVPVVLHLANQSLGIAGAVILSAFVMYKLPSLAPVTLISAWVFQNLIVSLVSPAVETLPDFNMIRSYNFLTTTIMWLLVILYYAQRRRACAPAIQCLMDVTLAAAALVAPFFMAGLLQNPMAAVIYLRNILTPLMLFQIFLLSAYRCESSTRVHIQLVAWAVVAMALTEAMARDDWLLWTNGYSYWQLNSQPLRESGFFIRQMQQTGQVMVSLKDGFLINLLNSEALAGLGLKVYRLMGPNMHAISFGYALAFFMAYMMLGRRYFYAAICIPLLLLVSAKGPIIEIIFVILMFAMVICARRSARGLFPVLCLFLGIYATIAVVTGIRLGDYHAIGLLSGLEGFMRNPLGHGLGVGGNLSGNFAAVDWAAAQQAGRISGAAESGIGVLLYQMGVAGIVLPGVYAFIAHRCWQVFQRTRSFMLILPAAGLLTILANALLQEEALFAPLALGLMAAFAGLSLGEQERLAWFSRLASQAVDSRINRTTRLKLRVFESDSQK
jgi:hypothetical protein